MRPSVHPTHVKKYSPNHMDEQPDLVAVEEPLEIRLGFGKPGQREQKQVSVTMRTPGHDFELAIGFLFTEGIIHSFDEVESIKHCTDDNNQLSDNIIRVEVKPEVRFDPATLQRNFYTTSSCGVCGKASIESVKVHCNPVDDAFRIGREVIQTLPAQLSKSQEVFERTGGLHAVGLFRATGDLKLLREDVGRHNAMDKVIGASLFEKQIPIANSMVLVSGRASFELVQKAAVAGIPMLAAVGAPSSLAIELAQECGMTLVGFVKEDRFNVYTAFHRII
ncbi:MAG: formate dehydrogenase accessory sulfurtransferase FdhD [Cyclobacteriaceae bacterium]